MPTNEEYRGTPKTHNEFPGGVNEYEDYIDARMSKLDELLDEPNRIIKATLDKVMNEKLSDSELNRLLGVINVQYDQIQSTLYAFSQTVIPAAYSKGVDLGAQMIASFGEYATKNTKDFKAINILIRDMNDDFTRAIDGGRVNVGTYFKFSKQGRITETEISEAVAKGLIDGGTGRDAKKMLRKVFDEKGTNVFDQSSLSNYIERKVKQNDRRVNAMDINEGLKEYLKESFEEKFREEKFMQIINKNGDIMNFQVKTYSNLVSRTRIGDAQCSGIIDNAEENGIAEFKITAHNSDSFCRYFEGKIFSSKKDDKYPYLYDYSPGQSVINKPVYHPNCLHRLMPYVEVD